MDHSELPSHAAATLVRVVLQEAVYHKDVHLLSESQPLDPNPTHCRLATLSLG